MFPRHPENKAVEAALYKQSLKKVEHAQCMGCSRGNITPGSIGGLPAPLKVRVEAFVELMENSGMRKLLMEAL